MKWVQGYSEISFSMGLSLLFDLKLQTDGGIWLFGGKKKNGGILLWNSVYSA